MEKLIDKLNIMHYNTFIIKKICKRRIWYENHEKKLIAAAALVTLTLSLLAGCAEKAPAGGDTGDGDEKQTLVMATNAQFPPYEYYDGDNIVGIDAEVAALIADKLGMELEIADMSLTLLFPVFSRVSTIWEWRE